MIYNKTFKGGPAAPQAKVGHVSHSILQWGADNNFEQWSQFHGRRASEAHGVRANLFMNGKAWIRGPMSSANYLPVEANDADGNPMVPLTDNEMQDQRKAYMKEYNKQVAKDVEENIKFFSYIEKHLSDQSLLKIENHDNYAKVRADYSIQGLWDILKDSHLHHFGGKNIAIHATIRREKQKAYEAARQRPDQSLAEYHRVFLDLIAVKEAYKCTPMTAEEHALDFIHSLNKRHEEFQLSIRNDGLRGTPLPTTINQVVELAENYLIKPTSNSQYLYYEDEDKSETSESALVVASTAPGIRTAPKPFHQANSSISPLCPNMNSSNPQAMIFL